MLGRGAEQLVEVEVITEELGIASRVGPVQVHQRRVERQRRNRDQLGVVVRRAHCAQLRVDGEHVRAKAGSARQERQPARCRVERPLQHAFVVLGHLDRSALASGLEVRFERDRVERDKPEHQTADLPGRAQQPDVRTAVRDHGQVPQVASQDRSDQRHRLATRAPAADADGHARPQAGDYVVL